MFYPKDFNRHDWARLAKLVRMNYVVFTAKHHAGFCTREKDTDTVYAFETNVPWEWATWREFTLKSVRASSDTEVEVVGQTGDNRCWSTAPCKSTWRQAADGLHNDRRQASLALNVSLPATLLKQKTSSRNTYGRPTTDQTLAYRLCHNRDGGKHSGG